MNNLLDIKIFNKPFYQFKLLRGFTEFETEKILKNAFGLEFQKEQWRLL